MSLIPLTALPAKGLDYSRNYLDRLIKNELMPQPIYMSPRKRAMIEAEIDQVIAARIAGKSNLEIQDLVRSMTANRKVAA